MIEPKSTPWRLLASLQTLLWVVLVLCAGMASANRTVEPLNLHQADGLVQGISAEDGCFFLRARWMDPNTGRFVSEDPYEGDPEGPMSLHRFMYANGGPVNGVDPSGNMTLLDVKIGLLMYSHQFVKIVAPILYAANHLTGKLGTSTIALAIRQCVTAGNGLIYRSVGLDPRLLRLHAGQMFEKIVTPAMKILGAKTGQTIASMGRIVAKPDFKIGVDHIVDAKLGQYISMGQLEWFAKSLSSVNGTVTYLTLTAPPEALINRAVAVGLRHGVTVNFISILP